MIPSVRKASWQVRDQTRAARGPIFIERKRDLDKDRPLTDGCGRERAAITNEEYFTMTVQLRAPKDNQPSTEDRGGETRSAKDDVRQDLLNGLNQDLAGEYQAILMYTHYSAKLTGPYRRELRSLFQAEIADEQGHAQLLADKVAALGGEPTTTPRLVPSASLPREMLIRALATEEEAIANYKERIHTAERFGDIGLKSELEKMVADETRHKEELERILAGWDQG
jgi:bacterioferritin